MVSMVSLMYRSLFGIYCQLSGYYIMLTMLTIQTIVMKGEV